MKGKQLIAINQWHNRPDEVRVEVYGNGDYILVSDLEQYFIKNARRLANEATRNLVREEI